jgi:hypothetical protein
MSNESFLSVGEAAEALNVAPRAISNALYDRKLDLARCPKVAGRRLIPKDYLPSIAAVLRSQKEAVAAEPVSVAGLKVRR